jgi:hypothetical protein
MVLRRIAGRFSYANVMATIAVFLALGGGAYAVTAKKNSVKSKSIKDGQVLTADLGSGAVTKPKLAPDVNAAFLPAGAASSFVPRSGIQRLSFLPTSCDMQDFGEGCIADPLVSFGGVRIRAECFWDAGGQLRVTASSNSTFGANVALLRDGEPAHIAPATGTFVSLVHLGGTDNVVGTIVIQQGTTEETTIPFHAYAAPGIGANRAACVFEGTAIDA